MRTKYNTLTFFDRGGKNSTLMTTIYSQGRQENLANKHNPILLVVVLAWIKMSVKCTRADSLTQHEQI